MTKDDVLFGYRLQVFDLAGRTSVWHACRVFGIHRSTYYAWKGQVDQGRAREAQAQAAPPPADAQPALGRRRAAHR